MSVAERKESKLFDNRYEILAQIGRGSSSVVYLARYSITGADVALKVLLNKKHKSSIGAASKLRKEALAMISARHKYVIRLDDFHTVDNISYLAMEYAPGKDLKQFFAKKKMTAEQARAYLVQLASALDFIHHVGILHRDIKPENILVMSNQEVRIADFGVATLPGEKVNLKELQAGIGTFTYLPPEVINATDYSTKSDIYSLGLTFYEMLSAQSPFENRSIDEQIKVKQENNFKPLKNIPQELSNIIMQMLEFDPDNRITAKEIIAALQNQDYSTDKRALSEDDDNTLRIARKNSSSDFKDADKFINNAQSRAEDEEVNQEIVEDNEEENLQASNDSTASASKYTASAASLLHAIDNKTSQIKNNYQSKKNSSQSTARYAGSSTATNKRTKTVHAKLPTLRIDTLRAYATKKNLLVLATIAVLFLFFGQNITSIFTSSKKSATHEIVVEEVHLSGYSGGELSFPNLPTGMYAGVINNIVPSKNIPLTFISINNGANLITAIGIEGWTPVMSTTSETMAGNNSTRAVSNGMVLDFTATDISKKISGEYRNIMTGEKGVWQVVPVK